MQYFKIKNVSNQKFLSNSKKDSVINKQIPDYCPSEKTQKHQNTIIFPFV